MSERRYSDDEIRAIFDAAARSDAARDTDSLGGSSADAAGDGASAPSPPSGMSLEELQDIGREVGLSDAAIAAAARQLDTVGATGSQVAVQGGHGVEGAYGSGAQGTGGALAGASSGGALARLDATRRLPLTVAAATPLAGPLSDAQWDELVGRLRATFNATGTVQQTGGLRTWRNGNLQAHVEPVGDGWQLRLFTRSGQYSQGGMIGSWAGIGGGLLALIGQPEGGIFMAGAGLAALMWSVVGSRGWARRRTAQFDALTAWARGLGASSPGAGGLGVSPGDDSHP